MNDGGLARGDRGARAFFTSVMTSSVGTVSFTLFAWAVGAGVSACSTYRHGRQAAGCDEQRSSQCHCSAPSGSR